MSIDLQELRKLCVEYDAYYGDYPESEFQGRAMFFYFMEFFTKITEEDAKRLEKEYTKEIEKLVYDDD